MVDGVLNLCLHIRPPLHQILFSPSVLHIKSKASLFRTLLLLSEVSQTWQLAF